MDGRLNAGHDGSGEPSESYALKLLSVEEREEADSLIRAACTELGWADLAGRLVLPARDGFIIYHIPGIAARSLGRAPSPAAAAVMHVLTASFKMIDWLLDEEDWPERESEGPGPLANRAQAATVVAFRLLDAAAESPEAALRLRQEMEAMTLPFCLAQQGSVRPQRHQEVYWRTVDGTTGALFSFGLSLGAQASGHPDGIPWGKRLAPLGLGLARLLQINDDLKDAIKTPEEPDWSGRTLNLAILYAETADHPERDRFRAALAEGRALTEVEEMIEILFRSGAVSFCTASFIAQYQEALKELERIAPPDQEAARRSLRHLVAPALYLLEEATGAVADDFLKADLSQFSSAAGPLGSSRIS